MEGAPDFFYMGEVFSIGVMRSEEEGKNRDKDDWQGKYQYI